MAQRAARRLAELLFPVALRSRLPQRQLATQATVRPLDILEEMVSTRSAARAEDAAEEWRADRAFSVLEASCSNSSAPPVSSKHAAVLVPLFRDNEGHVHVVLTRRSSELRSHGGEVCLPGGKREPGDADDVATALREAHEELGIRPGDVRLLGCLPPFLSKHLLSVTPVLGVVPAELSLRPCPQEVDAVFTAPLRMFLRLDSHRHRDVEWRPGMPYRLHYFDLHHSSGEDFLIWGLTAGMLIVVAERAFGRPAEFGVNPPGARPFTALVYHHGRLAYRDEVDGGLQPDGEQRASSAASEGSLVTDAEAAAAIGGDAEQPEQPEAAAG